MRGNSGLKEEMRYSSQHMMDEMTIRVAIRTTARISFVLFLGVFLGDALCSLVPAAQNHEVNAKQDSEDGYSAGP